MQGMDGISVLAAQARTIKGYGWTPDVPDFRDYKATNVLAGLQPVPPGTSRFSLRSLSPEPPWNQGNIGSCTGHGVAFLVQFERKRQGLPDFRPSRLALYYGGRVLGNTVAEDAGAQIRDVMKCTATIGAGPESLWPYDTAQFAAKPHQAYLDSALLELTTEYLSNPRDLNTIKRGIYNGYPIVMGFSVYESFESDAVTHSGMMPMPQRKEQLMGGHCVVWTGWDDALVMPNTAELGALETRNSWDITWGDAGHFWMPYAVSQERDMSTDFWSMRMIAL
jgi:C1A family cysteine protease